MAAAQGLDNQSVMSLPAELASICASYLENSDFVSLSITCSGFNEALQPQCPIRMVCCMEYLIHGMHRTLQVIASRILSNHSSDKLSLNAWRGCIRRMYDHKVSRTINLWLIDVIRTYDLFKISYLIPENAFSYHELMISLYRHVQNNSIVDRLRFIKGLLVGPKWKYFQNAYPSLTNVMDIIKQHKAEFNSISNFILRVHQGLWQQMELKIHSIYLSTLHISVNPVNSISIASFKHFKATKQYIHDLWFNILESVYYRLYDSLLGNWQNIMFEDNDRISLFFEMLDYSEDAHSQEMFGSAFKIVTDIKKNMSNDAMLMRQIRDLFWHISDFLGLVGNNSLHQAEYKQRVVQCVQF